MRDEPASATHRRASTDKEKEVSAHCQQLADNYGTAVVWALVCKPSEETADGSECCEQACDRLPAPGYVGSPRYLNLKIAVRVREISVEIRRADNTTRLETFPAGEVSQFAPMPGRSVRASQLGVVQYRPELSSDL